jgi:O-methyltransferase
MGGVLVRMGRCLPRRWRRRLKRGILLRWPALYARDWVRYEQSLAPDEVAALLDKLDTALDVPGDVIECGCFLCGTTVHLAHHLRRRQSDKRIYACDTFTGFEPAEFARERNRGSVAARRDFASNDFNYVQRKLARLGMADRVIPVRGLFQETLESLAGPFCFAFIDCDLHDSISFAARVVWARLSPGGCCVFDDYANEEYRSATKAIDAFVAEQAGTIREHGRLAQKMYFAVKKTGR